MIIGYIGGMGSGKTISMVRQAYKYYKQGYTILTNMKLNFSSKEITAQDIINFAKSEKGLYNTVVLIDEIHIFADSRRSSNKRNLLISYFVTQTRKQKVKLLFTTQHRNQIDKRVRDNVTMYVDCVKKERTLQNGENKLIIINNNNTRERFQRTYFLANPYFNLYDTEEIIFDKELL